MRLGSFNKLLMTQILSLGVSSVVMAQQTTATVVAPSTATGTSTTVIKPADTNKSPWGFDTSLEYSQKASQEEGVDLESSIDLTAAAKYKINDTFSTSVKSAISKQNNQPGDTLLSDTVLGLSVSGWKIAEGYKTLHSIFGVIPTSKSTQEAKVYTQLGLNNGLVFDGVYFQSKYILGLSKNFHEYEQTASGTANIEYRLSNLLEISVPIVDKFTIVSNGVYKIGWTYTGNNRYAFGFGSDLNYDIKDNMSASIGFSTEGNALKANGVDSNIQIFNEYTSVYKAGMSYAF